MKVWDKRSGRSKQPLLHYFGAICGGDARKAHARALAARGQRGDFTRPDSALIRHYTGLHKTGI